MGRGSGYSKLSRAVRVLNGNIHIVSVCVYMCVPQESAGRVRRQLIGH